MYDIKCIVRPLLSILLAIKIFRHGHHKMGKLIDNGSKNF